MRMHADVGEWFC